MKRIILLLISIAVSVWLAIGSIDNNLQIIACDVGQGDAILIQQGNNQVLIDGGPDNKVLDCLGRHLPFYDKTIEMVILTHPDLDHLGGLINVFKDYEVLKLGEFNTDSSSVSYQVLKKEVGGSSTEVVSLSKGMVVRLGLIHLDILHPSLQQNLNINRTKSGDSNNNSLVILLDYAQFEALFTGDVENIISDYISEYENIKDIEYIKVNHHGSKNGMTEKLLKEVNPEIAVISVGHENRYGHPDAEILELLNKYNSKVLRTDYLGDVVIQTDGNKYWFE